MDSVDKPPSGQTPSQPPTQPSTNGNGYHLPKKIAIVYTDAKREYYPSEEQFISDQDSKKDADAIANYLQKMGIETLLFPGNSDLPHVLKESNPDMVFNFVDTVKGSEYLSSIIPGILELLEIPYTGAGILGKSLDGNRFLIHKLFEQNGVPLPHYQLFNSPTDPLESQMRFPLITKLNEVHGCVEISKAAISENEQQLRERLKFLIKTYNQPVLAEEFIVGKEVSVFVVEGVNTKVYMAEKIFTKKSEGIYMMDTFEDKWLIPDYSTYHYEKYDDPILKEYVRKAFDVVGMADYGKFDIRVDSSNRYYFIDSNANPAYGPKESLCAIGTVLDMYGVTFTDLLKRLIINTMNEQSSRVEKDSLLLNELSQHE